MAINIFSSKKKDPRANMSYMGQSVYSQPTTPQKTPFIQTSGRSFLGIPEKVTIGGKKTVSQPTQQTSTPKPVTQVTVGGKIPASGVGSQYANQTIPKPTTTVETPKVQSAADKYLANIQALGAKQQAAAKQRALDNENRLKERYNLANQGLEGQIPELDAELENFKATEAAGLAEAKKAAEAQKATTSDYYGEAQRLAAQTRNETRGQTGRTFANLGTIDSRGEGSYQQGMENIDTEFNRETQKRLNEKAAKLSDIDSTYLKAEVASNNAIRAKEAEKAKLVRQIKLAQQQNNLDLADQLTAAYQVADDTITEIENNLMQLKYASEQETEKTQRELDQLKGLSESFLTTGKPSTMNDMLFMKDNPDFAKNIVSLGLGTGEGSKSIVSAIDRVLSGNTQGISGTFRSGNLPILAQATGSGATQADWNALKSMLSLEGRSQLKGSGAISDFEAKILEQAATEGIDPTRMTEEQFVSRLSDLRNRLAGSGSQSGTIRVRENASGQTGVIPSSEFNPSLYTRI